MVKKVIPMWVVLAVALAASAMAQGDIAIGDGPDGTRYYAVKLLGEEAEAFRRVLSCGSLGDCSEPEAWVFQADWQWSSIQLIELRGCGPTQSCPEPGPPGEEPRPPIDGCGPTQGCPEPGPAVIEYIRRGWLYDGEAIELTGVARQHAWAMVGGR